jgi:hypothetical protein
MLTRNKYKTAKIATDLRILIHISLESGVDIKFGRIIAYFFYLLLFETTEF